MATVTDDPNLCSICLDAFKQPTTLLCEHTFCTKCVREYRDKCSGLGQQSTFPCPVCREETDYGADRDGKDDSATEDIKKSVYAPIPPVQYCDVCMENNKSSAALVICRLCSEAMCADCEACHRAMKATRGHRIAPIDSGKNEDTMDLRHCSVHREEPFEEFCDSHQSVCCSKCILETHGNCQTTKLKQISESVETINNLHSLIGDMRSYEADIENIVINLQQSAQNLEREKKRMREEMENFRKKVLAKISLELSRHLPATETAIQCRIDEIVEDIDWCVSMNTRLNNNVALLEDICKSSQQQDMFLSYHLMEERLVEIRKNIVRRHSELKDSTFEFNLHDICKRFVHLNEHFLSSKLITKKTVFILPKYLKPVEDRRLHFLDEIHVLVTGENQDCKIRSVMFLPENKVLAFDKTNKALKIFQTSKKGAVATKSIADHAEILTLVSDSVCLLTQSNGSLATFNIGASIFHHTTSVVPHNCHATLYINGIYVGTCLTSLKVFNVEGKIFQTLNKDNTGKQLFFRCRYISYYANINRVYVADEELDRLLAFNVVGKQLETEPAFIYEDQELRYPTDMVVSRPSSDSDPGCVFLCGFHSENIHLINALTGQKLKIFPMTPLMPLSITLDENELKLAISSLDELKRNFVQMYRLF